MYWKPIKWVFWQTVKTLMYWSIMRHFIRTCTICYENTFFRDWSISTCDPLKYIMNNSIHILCFVSVWENPSECKGLNPAIWPYYEGCSNMNASSFITFSTYMLRQNAIPFWKELFVAFKMASNIKKHSLYFSSYIPLYKCHSCILKFFWSKLQCTFWYMCGYSVISL